MSRSNSVHFPMHGYESEHNTRDKSTNLEIFAPLCKCIFAKNWLYFFRWDEHLKGRINQNALGIHSYEQRNTHYICRPSKWLHFFGTNCKKYRYTRLKSSVPRFFAFSLVFCLEEILSYTSSISFVGFLSCTTCRISSKQKNQRKCK